MSITSKRFSAYLLDIFFIYLLLSLITSIKFINPTYDKFIDSYEKYSEVVERYTNKEISLNEMQELNKDNYYNVTKYSISSNIVIVVGIFLYFGVFQKYNHGQTLGKKIMKLRVTSNDENEISIWKYLLRTLPMYFVLIGSVISFLINSILVFVLDSSNYMMASSIVTYFSLGIGIIDVVMLLIRKDKRGLHDILANTKVEFE